VKAKTTWKIPRCNASSVSRKCLRAIKRRFVRSFRIITRHSVWSGCPWLPRGVGWMESSSSGTRSGVIVRTMRPLEGWSLGRVANCRGTRLHAPLARPTGATPFVSSKHVIVAVIPPGVRTCVRATTVTTRRAESVDSQWIHTRIHRDDDAAERGTRGATLDLCLLTLKISRFSHTFPVARRRRLIDSPRSSICRHSNFPWLSVLSSGMGRARAYAKR